MHFDRRSVLKGGAAVGLAGTSLLDFAKAWAQSSPFKPEPGAQLGLLRWKRFVQAEDDAFMKMVDAFTRLNDIISDVWHITKIELDGIMLLFKPLT